MSSTDVLTEAHELIHKDRQESYGTAAENLGQTAALWSALFGVEVTAHQVALAMILVKVARTSKSHHRDSLVDIAGYAGCADMAHVPEVKITHSTKSVSKSLIENTTTYQGGVTKKKVTV